jgi:hypothetical protein
MIRVMRRRLTAFVAAYAVTLQAVLASFAVLSAVGGVAGLCASGASRQAGSDPRHVPPCVACTALCGDGSLHGVDPAGLSALAGRGAALRIERPMLRLAERSAPRNLPPSRAPPPATRAHLN